MLDAINLDGDQKYLLRVCRGKTKQWLNWTRLHGIGFCIAEKIVVKRNLMQETIQGILAYAYANTPANVARRRSVLGPGREGMGMCCMP